MKSDPLLPFENLVTLAKHETTKEIDIAHRVLQTLYARRLRHAWREPEYSLVGFGSLCVACAALLVFSFSTGDDTYIMLVQPFFMELP